MNPSPTILVVDDRPDDADLTATVLAAKLPFARVEVATDAATFAAALAGDVAAVVCEQRLSWSDGVAVVGAAKRVRPGCVAILFTAGGADAAVAAALDAGLDGFVVRSSAGYLRLPVVLGRLLDRAGAADRVPATGVPRAVEAANGAAGERAPSRSLDTTSGDGRTAGGGNGATPEVPGDVSPAAQAARIASLERSNRELQQFASVVSHDLQEPLNLTVRFARMLVDRCADQLDDEAGRYLGHVVANTERMQTMIDDVLEYSRVESRGRPFAPVDTGAVVRRVLADLAVLVEESGAEIVVDPLPTVVGDGRQLAQVFQNLIGNALKFRGGAAPRVRVSARETAEGWIFSVRDNGIGIEPENHERIFEMFQRLHTESEYPGTGIGLAICSRIVARHEGRIWLDSTPGQGTTFHVLFPTGAGDGATDREEGAAPRSLAPETLADTARGPWSETH